MKEVYLPILCFLTCSFAGIHPKGYYSWGDAMRKGGSRDYVRQTSQFGGEYNLPKNAGEKETPMILEEAYPSISRRFYGSSVENHGDYRAKLGSFNVDHEGGDHNEYGNMEPFDISIPDMNVQHGGGESELISPRPMMQEMGESQKSYANHLLTSHTSYPDHGVVISDNVAKKIGLYDKDYLKKLGLDSKDNSDAPKESVEASGESEFDGSLPKEEAKKEKERMEKIGVEDFRNGKHADDKKQVEHMKEVFKSSEAGINYNQNGVMVDKKLAQKLGLYDKDYLKKLGVWDEKDSDAEGEDKSKAKGKDKDKSNTGKATSRSHDVKEATKVIKSSEKEDESSAVTSGDSESGVSDGKSAGDSTIDIITDPKNSNTSAEESKANENSASDTPKSSDEKSNIIGEGDENTAKAITTKKGTHVMKSSKRDDVPGAHPHHRHHHHHHRHHRRHHHHNHTLVKKNKAGHPHHADTVGAKNKVVRPNHVDKMSAKNKVIHHHHLDEAGVKRQLLNFIQPSNNFGMDPADVNSKNLANIGGVGTAQSIMMEAQQLETGQNAINQNSGFNGAENSVDMNTVQPGSRSDQISSDPTAQRGAEGYLPDLLSKANSGGDIGGDISALQDGAIQNDNSKMLANAGMEGVENVDKSNFNGGGGGGGIGGGGGGANRAEETAEDSPPNLNDVYIDGDPSDMSKLEKPGNWILQKSLPLKSNVNGRLDDKSDSIAEMVDKLVPMDKGQHMVGLDDMAATAGPKELPGEGSEIMKGVTPSDSDMINQILKNGDQAIETNEGRGELKKLLSGAAGLPTKLIEDMPQSRSMNSFNGGNGGIKGGSMPLAQMIPPTNGQQQMKVDDEDAVPESNSLLTGESSPQQVQTEGEMLPSSITGLQASTQAQTIDNSPAQQRNEIGMKGQNYMGSIQPQSVTNTADPGFNDITKLNGEAAGQYAQLQMASNIKTDNPQVDMMKSILSQNKQSLPGDLRQRKEIEIPGTSELRAFPTDDGTTWSQGMLRNQRFQYHRGNRIHKFIHLKSRTKDDQPIREVDYDDSHSSIGIGAKRSGIFPLESTRAKVHETIKRQYLSEPEMNALNTPRIEGGTMQSTGIQQNSMLGNIQGKGPALGGMIGGNMMTDSKTDYETSFKKNGNIEANGISYYMNTSPTVVVGKKDIHSGDKRGEPMNSENGMNEDIQVEMGGMNSMHGGSMETPVVQNGMGGMGGIGGISGVGGFDGAAGLGPSVTMDGISDMNGGTSGISNMGGIGKPMMAGYSTSAGFHPRDAGETGEGMGVSMGSNMRGNMGVNLEGNVGADDRSIDNAMAEEDKIAADSTARNAGKLLQKSNDYDMSARNTGNLLKNAMNEGSMNRMNNRVNNRNFNKGHNNSESNSFSDSNDENDGDGDEDDESFNDGDMDENEDSKMHSDKAESNSKTEDGETRGNDETDLNEEIGDQVVKNNGHMTGHNNENVVHGTPCVDCHTAGAIGHGAVISGSEAKKIGLNDEAYLKRLGIKECKIKGPGFSEGNHGGVISDEWAKKLDGFDKKYLQQLGIPEEALEGNTATRDCKFVERIAEVLQAQGAKEVKEVKGETNSSTNAPPEAVKNDPSEDATKEEAEKPTQKVDEKKKEGKKGQKVTEEVRKTEEKITDATDPDAELKKLYANGKKEGDKETELSDKTPEPETENKKEDASIEGKKTDGEEKQEDTKEKEADTVGTTSEALESKAEEGKSGSKSENNSASTHDILYSDACVEADPLCENDDSKEENNPLYGENEGGLDMLNVRDDMIKHLSEEMAITCHEINVGKNKKPGTVHENCTVKRTNNSTHKSSSSQSTDDDDGENIKAKSESANIQESTVDKDITNGNETTKTDDMDFIKRKQTVVHKKKHLEDLKAKLQKLNSGILRSKITSGSKQYHKKGHDHLKRSTYGKGQRKKLALKRIRRLHQLRKLE